MGGDVSLESTPGSGSEFKVVLDFPLASARDLAVLQSSPLAPGKNALPGVRVLVVDDSPINLDVTKRILELEGARVLLASNGQEALDLLRSQPDLVDLVLMDLQMPVLDGHDATRQIRLEPGLVGLPVIALTAGAMSSERERATAAGIDDYIVKPFDAQSLVRSILRHVQPAPTAIPAGPVGAVGAIAHDAAPWPVIEGIDAVDARARMGGDFELFRSALRRLLDEFDDVTLRFAQTVALARHAARMHKLRGSAGTLGAKDIQHLAGLAEAACLAGDRDRATDLAHRLATHMQRLRQCTLGVVSAASAGAHGEGPSSSEAIPPDVMTAFIALLRRQSLAALGTFDALSPQLRGLLRDGRYALLRRLVDDLKFDEAAQALEDSLT